MYDSQVSFTLDTICPWLDQALSQVRSSPNSSGITFAVHFEPYQLYPKFAENQDKQKWYLENKHNNNAEAQKLYQAHMASLAAPFGVQLSYDGSMGNTFEAHRVIQYFQEQKGAETADRLVDALYRRYFEEARHPAAESTLVEACVEAGIDEAEAKEVVGDAERGASEVKQKLRTVGMDVDAVPVITVEGRKRDITLTGAKEVSEYVKALEMVAKDST